MFCFFFHLSSYNASGYFKLRVNIVFWYFAISFYLSVCLSCDSLWFKKNISLYIVSSSEISLITCPFTSISFDIFHENLTSIFNLFLSFFIFIFPLCIFLSENYNFFITDWVSKEVWMERVHVRRSKRSWQKVSRKTSSKSQFYA